MTRQERIRTEYFMWLYTLVRSDQPKDISYSKLLTHLHDTEFKYLIERDANRAEDGIDLRYRFAYEHADLRDAEEYLAGPCSVLEMMVALAMRCEENIMDDPDMGNRTGQWFWKMIVNLGLGAMSDARYDRLTVDEALNRFLHRDYAPDGRGGLFTIRHCESDMRHAEIWHQLCWYLDSIM